MTCYTSPEPSERSGGYAGWPSRDTTNSQRDANPSSLSLFAVTAEAHTRLIQ